MAGLPLQITMDGMILLSLLGGGVRGGGIAYGCVICIHSFIQQKVFRINQQKHFDEVMCNTEATKGS